MKTPEEVLADAKPGPHEDGPFHYITRPGGAPVELAQLGYDAYGAKADWKAYDGKPMPQWQELPSHIRGKWRAAVAAIEAALVTSMGINSDVPAAD